MLHPFDFVIPRTLSHNVWMFLSYDRPPNEV